MLDATVGHRCTNGKTPGFTEQQFPGDLPRCFIEIFGAVAIKRKQGGKHPAAKPGLISYPADFFRLGTEVYSPEGRLRINGPKSSQFLDPFLFQPLSNLGKKALVFLIGKNMLI